MKILHLSDTHNKHNELQNLPEADILVHSGDFSFAGSQSETLDFLSWFIDLPYKYKIFIAGNHDDYLYNTDKIGLPDNCHYLCHSAVTIEGIQFYGVPMFMEDRISGKYEEQIISIPIETDILITHQPPFQILDRASNKNYGHKLLLDMVKGIQPKHHLFGHIHDAYGMTTIGATTFVNAAILDEQYELANDPILLEV